MNETTLKIHAAICYDSPEECLENGGDCVKAAEAINEATTPLTVANLDALGNGDVVKDKHGDIGVIHQEKIHYPDTAPLTLKYADRFGPFEVLHTGSTK